MFTLKINKQKTEKSFEVEYSKMYSIKLNFSSLPKKKVMFQLIFEAKIAI